MKKCNTCAKMKPLAAFGPKWAKTASEKRRRCLTCEGAAAKDWAEANPERVAFLQNRGRIEKYGITLREYERMLAVQDFCCAICHTDEPGGPGRWHIDHDHKTRKVRGLLCHQCNLMIGHAKDDVITLKSAIQYLKRSRKPS